MSLSPRAAAQNAAPDYVDPDLRFNDAARSSVDGGADFATSPGAAAETSPHSITEEDAQMWHRLKVHPTPPEPKRYDTSIVAVNASGIGCVENASTIKVRPGTGQSIQPIHASCVAQLHAPDTRYDRANLMYAAGQSPTNANYKNMLIQGIRNGLGTYQLVSSKAHRYGFDSKETTLIELLKQEFENSKQSNASLDLSDRYQVTDLTKLHDGGDHIHYAMSVYDRATKKTRTVPLTQAGLRFTDKVLQPEKIERAHELMQAHCDIVAKQAHANGAHFEWKNLMVLSHAGFGRNATVITYCRIAALAQQDTKQVHEKNCQAQLEQAIATGMGARDPNFVHSLAQASALRVALKNRLKRMKNLATQERNDGASRMKVWKTFVEQSREKAAQSAADERPIQTPVEPKRAQLQTAAATTNPTNPIMPASTTSEPSISARAERQQGVIEFFSSAGNQSTLNLDTVSTFDTRMLEQHHQFIQHLFPTDTRSAYNATSPVLDAADFLALRNNDHVSAGLDRGFQIMLRFYGLEFERNEVKLKNNNPTRIEACLQAGSHHALRLTRMIRSMGLFGKSTEAKALNKFLQNFCHEHIPDHTSLAHWAHALDAPLALVATDEQSASHQTGIHRQYPGLLFPNKTLLSDPKPYSEDPDHTPPNPNKRALFKKQREIYNAACTQSHNLDTPLKAMFSSPELIAAYKSNTHLAARFDATKTCDSSAHAGFYFDQPASVDSDPTQPVPYEVHVDFANQFLGGGWASERCFAQEEVAFIENVGLARVTDQAHRPAQPHELLQLLPGASDGSYRTRLDDGVPAPILIEGCERVAHLKPYGGKAARLGKNILDPANFDAIAKPAPTNWLAIAAQNYRRTDLIRNNRGTPDEIWITKASPEDRHHAFHDLFRTAHAGFTMAKKLADSRPLTLHTGLLGCGVFANSRTLSMAAQLLAAKVVGVDALRFYDVAVGDEKFAHAERVVAQCTGADNNEKSVGSVAAMVLDRLRSSTGTRNAT